MLHIVNKSPYSSDSLQTCLSMSLEGSDILLIEDGVYACLAKGSVANRITKLMSTCNVYVLTPDLRARGILDEEIIKGTSQVDYDGFVELTSTNDRVQSWL